MVATILCAILILGIFMFICVGLILSYLEDIYEELETYEKIKQVGMKDEYEITHVEEDDRGYTVRIEEVE